MQDIDLGYPLSENKILPVQHVALLEDLAQTIGRDLPESFRAFYMMFGGLSLPNVWNGYFVYPLNKITMNHQRGDPLWISGEKGGIVLVFGSDGGGNLFAVRLSPNIEIIYVPNGTLKQTEQNRGIFVEEWAKLKVIAHNFDDFLVRISDDVKAFVAGDQNWKYLDVNLYDE